MNDTVLCVLNEQPFLANRFSISCRENCLLTWWLSIDFKEPIKDEKFTFVRINTESGQWLIPRWNAKNVNAHLLAGDCFGCYFSELPMQPNQEKTYKTHIDAILAGDDSCIIKVAKILKQHNISQYKLFEDWFLRTPIYSMKKEVF